MVSPVLLVGEEGLYSRGKKKKVNEEILTSIFTYGFCVFLPFTGYFNGLKEGLIKDLYMEKSILGIG